jgi:hypothetical protein
MLNFEKNHFGAFMHELRKITEIKNNTLMIYIPKSFKARRVEVLIKPVEVKSESIKKAESKQPLPSISCGEWPENFSLRREDLYEDQGR